MTHRQARQYEMLVRVRGFWKRYEDRFGDGGEGQKAFAAVAEAVAEADASNGEKQATPRISRQGKRVTRQGLMAQLKAMAGAARVLSKTVPDADARFPLPVSKSDTAVLQAALLFRKEVEPVKADFIRCGLPASFADDLQQSITAFEQAIAGRQAGKTGAKVSRVGIQAALRRGMDAVRSLDVLVPIALGTDPKAMTAWTRERRVALLATHAPVDPATPAALPQAS